MRPSTADGYPLWLGGFHPEHTPGNAGPGQDAQGRHLLFQSYCPYQNGDPKVPVLVWVLVPEA